MSEVDQTTQDTQEQPQIGLTLQDLRILAGAVELGAQRGAFRAGEMEVVGATYNKLSTFLAANVPADQPADADGAGDQNSEVTETTDSAE